MSNNESLTTDTVEVAAYDLLEAAMVANEVLQSVRRVSFFPLFPPGLGKQIVAARLKLQAAIAKADD